MAEQYAVVSAKNCGKWHRPADPLADNRKPWDAVQMACGLSLEPVNYFLTDEDANRYCGGRLAKYLCKHCAAATLERAA